MTEPQTPTPHGLTPDEILEGIEELNDFFTPRQHWSNASGVYGYSRPELTWLLAAKLADLVTVSDQRIAPRSLDEFELKLQEEGRNWWRLTPEERMFMAPIENRRGGRDLKDEMWMALCTLRTRTRRAKLEPHFHGLPYGWRHAKTRTFVTAGNIEPSRMLRFMVDENIQRLGIVGWRYPEPALIGHLAMGWLEFAESGLDRLREFLGERDRVLLGESAAFVKAQDAHWHHSKPAAPQR